jgi:SAM-dependent methyltransferase
LYALLTREGRWALESAMAFEPREKDFLPDFAMLAKRFPRETARAALTIAILRGEAAAKFPNAEKMYFTREALEQATPWAVAAHRARRFTGAERILDLGCSIGGDALALAAAGPVIGVELDEVRTAMVRLNARALRADVQVVQADVTELPFRLTGREAVFFDPARRQDHQRIFSVEDYQPPLSIIAGWLPDAAGLCVKVSPGVDLNEISGYDCEVEFVSQDGDLKEAALWFGQFRTTGRRATLLTGEAVHTLALGPEAEQPRLPLGEPGGYLYEPDPAVLRAGLVEMLGAELGAAQLDPQIAYLTADELVTTPFARVWPVEDWMPFQLKRLRAALRERGIGRLTVKKRGSPILPEDLIQQLRLEGDGEMTVFLTQMEGRPVVVMAGEEIR